MKSVISASIRPLSNILTAHSAQLPHTRYRAIVNIYPSLFARLSQTLGTVTW